jgi:hypothetical protein
VTRVLAPRDAAADALGHDVVAVDLPCDDVRDAAAFAPVIARLREAPRDR